MALIGVSRGPDDPVIGGYADAAATWWLEHIHGRRGSHAELLGVAAGPPPAPT